MSFGMEECQFVLLIVLTLIPALFSFAWSAASSNIQESKDSRAFAPRIMSYYMFGHHLLNVIRSSQG